MIVAIDGLPLRVYQPGEPMPRFRCPECCCGPAFVLHPPRGATPVCSRCGTVLEKQPLVRAIPLLVLLAVGSALVALSVPGLFSPPPPGPLQPGEKGSQTTAGAPATAPRGAC